MNKNLVILLRKVSFNKIGITLQIN